MEKLEDRTFDRTYRARREALTAGNAVKYRALCNISGIEPEDNELYDQGGIVLEKPCHVKNYTSRRTSKKSKNFAKYKLLLSTARSCQINVEDVMKDTETKRQHLIEIMGYHTLWAPKGRVNILDAKDSRIGAVYRRVYNQVRRQFG